MSSELPNTKTIVTHETVETTSKTGVDYQTVIDHFGCQLITPTILNDLKSLINKPRLHTFLERGLFFAHRDFDKLIKQCVIEKKNNFYIYTGRGPSSASLHIGHLIPFIMAKYFQSVFDVPVIIQITDDEKYFHSKTNATLEEFQNDAMKNIMDIIACGFDPKKTFIFLNSTYSNYMVHNLSIIQKKINLNQIKNVFGYNDNDNMGRISFPVCQMAPSFASSFPGILTENEVIANLNPIVMGQFKVKYPSEHAQIIQNLKKKRCLIVAAVDQDPYFKMVRNFNRTTQNLLFIN